VAFAYILCRITSDCESLRGPASGSISEVYMPSFSATVGMSGLLSYKIGTATPSSKCPGVYHISWQYMRDCRHGDYRIKRSLLQVPSFLSYRAVHNIDCDQPAVLAQFPRGARFCYGHLSVWAEFLKC
jgi:hypothetical protein